MKKQDLMDAMNRTAKKLGLNSWIEIRDSVFIPNGLNNLAHLMWFTRYTEDSDSRLIREQGLNLINKGRLIFED